MRPAHGTTNSIGNAINSGFNNYYMGKYLNGMGSGYNTNGYTPAPGMGIMPWRG